VRVWGLGFYVCTNFIFLILDVGVYTFMGMLLSGLSLPCGYFGCHDTASVSSVLGSSSICRYIKERD
jgi:hypothetical protein